MSVFLNRARPVGRAYKVVITKPAKRHYIKKFWKRYPGSQWHSTQKAIEDGAGNINGLMQEHKDMASLISSVEQQRLIKARFKVAKTNSSPRNSGCRYIAHVLDEQQQVQILLVYSKAEINKPRETQKWKQKIKQLHPEVGRHFKL